MMKWLAVGVVAGLVALGVVAYRQADEVKRRYYEMRGVSDERAEMEARAKREGDTAY